MKSRFEQLAASGRKTGWKFLVCWYVGFEHIGLEPTRVYRTTDAKDLLTCLGAAGDRMAAAVEGKFAGAFIRAHKPTQV